VIFDAAMQFPLTRVGICFVVCHAPPVDIGAVGGGADVAPGSQYASTSELTLTYR